MRRLIGVLALLFTLLALALPAFADTPDPLVPDRPAGAQPYGTQVPLYDDPRFEPWDYTYEGDSAGNGYVTTYFWMNQMMVTKAWMLKVALRTVEYALTTSFLTPLLQSAEAAMQSVDGALWQTDGAPLVVGALGLTGLWATLLYLQGRTERAWRALGGALLVVGMAAMLLHGGASAVNSAATLVRGVGGEVASAIDGESTTRLLVSGGDAAWRALVFEPWATGELSEEGREEYRSDDGLDGGEFLELSVPERNGICLYNYVQRNRVCPWWTVDFLPRRMLIAIWTSLSTLVYAGTLFVLAGGIIAAQLTLLLFLALAPMWLLAGLWAPSWAGRVFGRLMGLALGAVVAQAVLAATLAVLLRFSAVVMTVFPQAGWVFHSILIAGLAGLAFRYRYAWLNAISAAADYFGRRPGEAPEGLSAAERRRARAASAGEAEPVRPMEVSELQPVRMPQAVAIESLRIEGVEQVEVQSRLRTVFRQEMQQLRQQLSARARVVQRRRAPVREEAPELPRPEERRPQPQPAEQRERAPRKAGQRPQR